MKRFPRPRLATVFAAAAALALSLPACKPASKSQDPLPKLSFAADVRPVLEKHCVNCHHDGALMGNLKLTSKAAAFAPRPGGQVIVPGSPEQSVFYTTLVLPGSEPKAMPPEGHQIPAEQIAIIRRWISEGADWPEGPDGAVRVSPALRP